LPEGIYNLKRNEIIRGFRRFELILKTGRRFETENLCIYLLNENYKDGNFVKAGFVISKKKLKKLTTETESNVF
jgi:ribonuclease P protein component